MSKTKTTKAKRPYVKSGKWVGVKKRDPNEPDKRSNNGGHSTAGARKDPKDKKLQTQVFLSENELNSKGWKTKVCDQVENKMRIKIQSTCELNK